MFWIGGNLLPYDRLLNYIEMGLLLTWYDSSWIRVRDDTHSLVISETRPAFAEVYPTGEQLLMKRPIA
jgi:hypothetical protein